METNDVSYTELQECGKFRSNRSLVMLKAVDGLIDRFGLSFQDAKEMLNGWAGHGGNCNEMKPMLMSLQEWVGWWLEPDDNGKPRWDNRGSGTDSYVMGRYCDIGPYHIDNVFLLTRGENLQQSRFSQYSEDDYNRYRDNKKRWPELYDLSKLFRSDE